MKVTAFTIEGVYKLKSEEGNVLQIQPAAGWKTIRGAKAWAEKHGYEFEQDKEEPKMASKAQINNVTVDLKFNTAYVYYDSGSERMFPADKLPKTVAKWLAEHETADSITSVTPNGDGSLVVHYATGAAKTCESLDDLPKEIKIWVNTNGFTYNAVAETVEEAADQEADQNEPESDQNEPESDRAEPESDQVELVSAQTHREPTRRLQTPQPKSLALDIVEAVVSGLLMATRLSLIALAYLLMGLASTCQAIGEAVEWMTPRAASLIDIGRAVWTDTVRPAGKAAAVWMAEAVWFILI